MVELITKANPENRIIKPIETDCTVGTCRETDKIRQRKIRSETNIVSPFLCHQRRGVPCSRCRGSKPYCSRYNKHTLAQWHMGQFCSNKSTRNSITMSKNQWWRERYHTVTVGRDLIHAQRKKQSINWILDLTVGSNKVKIYKNRRLGTT